MHPHHKHFKRRRRWSPFRWIQKRTQRSVFAWILFTIFATMAIVVVLFRLFGTGNGFRDDFQRAERFIGNRFSAVWHNSGARHQLTFETARDLDATVRVLDHDNRVLDRAGSETCERPWRFDVQRNGENQSLGAVEICFTRRHRSPFSFVLALILSAYLLWKGAGAIAQRLSMPVETLAHAATKLGQGRWDTRITPGQNASLETITLAEVFNRMATRVETQISDQKTLLAAVSHELRTPLARMRFLTELGRNDGRAAHDKNAPWSRLDREIDELDTLVADLLASSRMDFTARPSTELDARDLVLRAIEAAQIDPTLLVVSDVCADESTRKLLGDATLLVRTLVNLIENAKKHGKGVRAIELDASNTHVIFSVCDDGAGLSAEEREKVFTPFYQVARGGQSNERANTGFGLALVRRVAEWHGGTVRAENLHAENTDLKRREVGARFVLSIPRATLHSSHV